MSAKHLFPIHYYRDASGNPLAGGLIYTYISGTATGKYTYADSSGETILANPIKLDSSGRADIWMDTDGPYTFVITDSEGTQIGSQMDGLVPTVAIAVASGGSDLDITGYSIITISNNHISLTPNSLGKVVICGNYKLPSSALGANQALTGTGTATLVGSAAGAVTFNALDDINAASPTSGYLIHYVSISTEWQGLAGSSLTWTTARFSDFNTAAVTFTNKSGAISQWTNDSAYAVLANIPAASMAFTNKTGNISQWTDDVGYNTTTEVTATQANMEAAADTSVICRPSNVHNHPGVPKAWLQFKSDSTLGNTYNVSSITVQDSFRFLINFTTPFSNTNYVIIDNGATSNPHTITSRTTSSCQVTANSLSSMANWSWMFFGDQ